MSPRLDYLACPNCSHRFKVLQAGENAPMRNAAPRWIAVSDGLPEEGVLVLVFLAAARTAYQAGFRLAEQRDGAWDFHDDFGIGGVVSHWMAIPEPPE